MKGAAILLGALLMVSACTAETAPQPHVTETPPMPLIHSPVDDGGTGIIGPGGGALLGSAIGGGNVAKYSILAGLAVGYALHGSNGPTLTGSAADEQRHAMARIMQAPLGTEIRWRTPADQSSGTITPVHEFQDANRGRCRDFTETRIVRASHGELTGTACLPD